MCSTIIYIIIYIQAKLLVVTTILYDRTLRVKESIQGHPLDPKQEMSMFSAKAVGNFRYLPVVTPWRQKELERLDRYWRQGFKTG